VFEVNKRGEIAWDFVNPICNGSPICTMRDDDKENVQLGDHPDNLANMIHRAYRYDKDYPGLKGKNLTPKGKLAPGCPEPFKLYKF
jgi:hypothetical protein